MPLTPFHLGPALFFGLLFFGFIDLPAFLVANVIVDFEPFLVLLLGIDYPLHGFFHTFLGGSIVAAILSLIMVGWGDKLQGIMGFFRLRQKSSPRNIWAASFLGVYLHIILDSVLYTDIKPFFPFEINFFYINSMFVNVYGFCVILSILGVVLYAHRLWKGGR